MRVGRGDLGHRRQQLAELPAVLVEPDTEVAAPGVVEHRERQPRLEHLVRDLGGWNGASHGNGRFSSGLNEYG